ncbi:MAG: VCBS repeat-containing protein [Planctomycetes bacterium]|nr:VCBS repeat-containing protein [Planctomycetota bacterium]
MGAKLLVVVAAVVAEVVAQDGPPPIPTELRARFGFTGPHIVKIGDGIHSLTLADHDGDGRKEILVTDPRRARLMTLRWRDGAFAQEPVSTDGQIAGFAVGDVHGDGKPDLLLVDARGRLIVRPGGDGKAVEPIDLGLGGRGVPILPADLDGDKTTDLVAFARTGIRWITDIAGKANLSAIEPLDENAHSLLVEDLDGDRQTDLALIAPGPSMNLRFRRGHGDGTFGPWRICDTPELQHLIAMTAADGQRALVTIEGPQRRIAQSRFAAAATQPALEWWALGDNQPTGRTGLPFVLTDVDGDGDQDLVLAQPERARLLLFLAGNGTFAMRAVPTLAGIGCLAAGDVDGDGKIDLVMASPEEDALAWKSGAAALDAFPERLQCADKPVACAVDPEGGVLVLARTEKRDAHVARVRPGQEAQKLLDLGRLPADPMRMLVADLGDAEGRELAFVVPGEGLRIVSLQPAAAAAPAAAGKGKSAGDIAGFTKKIEDGALVLAQHEGQPALLVARDRFLRLFRSDAQGQPRVLAQDNGPEGTAELTLATIMQSGDRLYFDKKNNKLIRTRRDAPAVATELPPMEFSHLLTTGDAALLLGVRGVLRVPFRDGVALQRLALHEPPTLKTRYWHGMAGDLDHDGLDDLALIDGNLPGVQILAGGKNELQRALAMPTFEAPASDGETSREPREIDIADVDGDGRADLVLIAHDRILIYPQEK